MAQNKNNNNHRGGTGGDSCSFCGAKRGDVEIMFQGMALDQAISEFNRYLKVKLVVQDQGLGATRLGGTFRTADPQSFLTALQDGFGIGHRREGDRMMLFRTGGNRGAFRA